MAKSLGWILAGFGLTLATSGCSSSPATVEEYDNTELSDRVSSLEERVRTLEEKPALGVPPVAPEAEVRPSAYLSVGVSERQGYPSMEACQSARASILQQYDQQCRAFGAIACSNPRVLCIPS